MEGPVVSFYFSLFLYLIHGPCKAAVSPQEYKCWKTLERRRRLGKGKKKIKDSSTIRFDGSHVVSQVRHSQLQHLSRSVVALAASCFTDDEDRQWEEEMQG